MKKLIFACLALGSALILYTIKSPQIIIGNKTIKVEIADSNSKRTQGLSDRKNLAPNAGMLFIFPEKSIQTFWMKNMLFPLDIIWIDQYKVVGFEESTQPEGENPKKIYYSPVPVDKVLELNAGMVKKLGIKKGQTIKLENIP